MKHSRTGELTKEIAAYEGMRTKLEADHRMRWAVACTQKNWSASTEPLSLQPMSRCRDSAAGLI